MVIKFIHRWRRQIFFNCLGVLIGLNMWRLPEWAIFLLLGLVSGLFFGYGFAVIYLHKKGYLKSGTFKR